MEIDDMSESELTGTQDQTQLRLLKEDRSVIVLKLRDYIINLKLTFTTSLFLNYSYLISYLRSKIHLISL